MNRRTILGAVAATLASGGCLGVLTGREPLERKARPARVAESTLRETGYELVETRTDEIRTEVTVAGQTREVHATNRIARYNRTVDLGPLGEHEFAVFAVVSTPAFEIAGRAMSPVEEWSNRKLATRLQEQYSELSVGEEVDIADVDTLSTTMSLSKFEGSATVAGTQDVDVYLHVGKVRHEQDFVIPIGIYPRRLSGEESNVRALVGDLSHG